MSIKDNFSQAVKELWKNDKMEDAENSTPDVPQANPTQLDQYLAQQEQANDIPPMPAAAPVQTAAPVTPAQPAPAAQPEAVQPQQQVVPAPAPMPTAAPQAPVGADANAAGVPLETPYYRPAGSVQPQQTAQTAQPAMNAQPAQNNLNAQYNPMSAQGTPANGGFGGGYGGNQNYGGGFVPPASGNVNANRAAGVTDEVTVISKNTVIDGNVRSLANMQVDGNIKGNVETTRDIEMTGKVVGDIKCTNANMNSAAMQGNLTTKGKMRMDRDTILIGDLTSQYADVNGRIRGKLEIAGKAELKRDAIVFGDINASTIAVTDGAIIQGYVNTTFLSKEDSRNAFPEAISLDAAKDASIK